MNVSEKLGPITWHDLVTLQVQMVVWEICLLTNAGIEHIWKFSSGA